jgi:uncharacterized coiled-coil protein SlyX
MLERILQELHGVPIVLISIGVMVFLILVGEALKGVFTRPHNRRDMRAVNDLETEVGSLTAEMKELRDMVTQHSMSLQQNVDSLAHRVDSLENNRTESEPIQQRLGAEG